MMEPFEPQRHLTKVSGRDYLEVKWRIVWFRQDHPDGSIVTDLIEHTPGQQATFRATVSWPTESGIVICTDFGNEDVSDFGDYLEKASTKAIGRALALAGYGTAFAPDHDFGADQQRVVDAPVDRPAGGYQPRQGAGQGRAVGPQEATPRQIKYMHAIAREVGFSEEELEERAQQVFNCTVGELDRRGVSRMIELIQAERPVTAG